MISVFGWPDPNTGFDQSEHALYTCYFLRHIVNSITLYQITSHSILSYHMVLYPIKPLNCNSS